MYGSEYNKSYLLGFDDKTGWGNTSFFTYFSEFNRYSPQVGYVEALVLFLLFLFSTVGNVFFITEVLRHKSSRTITNYFVCNLALADVMFTIGAPFIGTIRITGTWVLGNFTCGLMSYSEFVCGIVMIWTMAIISRDRYVCMNMNLSDTRRVTTKHVLIIAVVVWVLSLIGLIPLAVFFQVRELPFGQTTVKICTLVWPNTGEIRIAAIFTWTACVVGFFIPLVIISVNYFRIFKKLWYSNRAVATQNGESGNGVLNPTLNLKHRRRIRNIRIVKVLVILVILFLVMWLPSFIVFILIQRDTQEEAMSLPSHAFIAVVIIAYSNACINPFLYGLINGRLKKVLSECCSCCFKDDPEKFNSTEARGTYLNSNVSNISQNAF